MARTRSRSGGRGALRSAVLAVAVLVALASTAAVVLADDPQVLRLAVVGALWAFVLAAFAVPRRGAEADAPAAPGSELELRRTYEVELEREVAARREYELQLEVYLRRELERGLAEDVAALREEVGRMRGEMIDRLDGELRMERIETTRLIGGSLRALQDEARRLGIGLPPTELPAILDEAPPDPLGRYEPPPARYDPPAPSRYEPAPVSYPPPAPYEPPATYRPYAPDPAPYPPAPYPPAPRAPAAGESVPPARTPAPEPTEGPRRRRAREDGEDNEVMSRLLGR